MFQKVPLYVIAPFDTATYIMNFINIYSLITSKGISTEISL